MAVVGRDTMWRECWKFNSDYRLSKGVNWIKHIHSKRKTLIGSFLDTCQQYMSYCQHFHLLSWPLTFQFVSDHQAIINGSSPFTAFWFRLLHQQFQFAWFQGGRICRRGTHYTFKSLTRDQRRFNCRFHQTTLQPSLCTKISLKMKNSCAVIIRIFLAHFLHTTRWFTRKPQFAEKIHEAEKCVHFSTPSPFIIS